MEDGELPPDPPLFIILSNRKLLTESSTKAYNLIKFRLLFFTGPEAESVKEYLYIQYLALIKDIEFCKKQANCPFALQYIQEKLKQEMADTNTMC